MMPIKSNNFLVSIVQKEYHWVVIIRSGERYGRRQRCENDSKPGEPLKLPKTICLSDEHEQSLARFVSGCRWCWGGIVCVGTEGAYAS